MTTDCPVSVSQHIDHSLCIELPFPCEQNNPVKSVAENNMVCFRWLCRPERHQVSVATLVRLPELGETGGIHQRKCLPIWDGPSQGSRKEPSLASGDEGQQASPDMRLRHPYSTGMFTKLSGSNFLSCPGFARIVPSPSIHGV